MHGHVLGARFEVHELVGQGGMGEVYRGFDRRDARPVAIKLLHDQGAISQERFVLEAEVLRALRHPGIVGYVHHGQTPAGASYLVMEWLNGQTLAERLLQGPLPMEDVFALAAEVFDALSAAHEVGVVHRDLKPANIFLIDADPRTPRLIDFGVARARKQPQLTGVGTTVGTACYMAPEQARGVADIDGRADIFAMGSVLLEAATGMPTFGGENNFVILAKICLDEPIAVADRCPALPRDAVAFLESLLARDRKRRPSHAATLAAQARRISDRLAEAGGKRRGGHTGGTSSGQRAAATEQRAVWLVMILNEAGTDPQEWRQKLDGVRVGWSQEGVMMESIAGHAAVAVMLGSASPSQKALRAGRLALALHNLCPRARVTVVTGKAVWQTQDGLPIGDALERGTQLLEQAGSGDIVVDTNSAGVLAQHFDLGAGVPIRLLQRRRSEDSAVGSFVGRAEEVERLLACVADAEDQHSLSLAVVSSAAGGGKTRLLAELVRRLRTPDRHVLFASTEGYAGQRSLALVTALLRDAMGLRPDEEPTRERGEAYLRALLPPAQADRVMPFFLELAGLAAPPTPSPTANGPRRDADRHLGVWLLWIEALLRKGPLVLVVDDLPAIDGGSLRLLDLSAQALRHKPVAIIASRRSEAALPESTALDEHAHVLLPPLPDRDAFALCALERPDLEASGQSAIVRRAAGNPFVLKELLRTHAHGPRSNLPATVMALVQARLDGLDPELRRVLRVVSAFGAQAPVEGLLYVLGDHAATLRDRLRLLERAEVLTASGADDRTVRFRHGLYREASYASFVEDERRACHRVAATWLRAHGPVDPLILAQHLEEAQEHRDAVEAYALAAEQAVGRHESESVVRIAERAVACGARGETLGRIRLAECRSCRFRGDAAKAEALAREALTLVAPRSHAAVASELGFALLQQNRIDEIEALLRALLAQDVSRVPDLDSWYGSTCLLAIALIEAGRSEPADALLALYPKLETRLTARGKGHAAELRAERSILHHQIEAAVFALEQAETLLGQTDDATGALMVRMNRASMLADLACFDQARALMEQGLTEAAEWGLDLMAAVVRSNLSAVARRQGRLDEAVALAAEVVGWGVKHDNWAGQAVPNLYLAWAQWLRGDVEAAETSGRQAAALLAQVSTRQPVALAVEAQACLAQGKLAQARQAVEQAFAGALAGPLDEGDVFVAVACAQVRKACGDRDGARACVEAGLQWKQHRLAAITSGQMRKRYEAALEEHAALDALVAELLRARA